MSPLIAWKMVSMPFCARRAPVAPNPLIAV